MKLFYSPFHDFVHKVLVVIAEAGIADEVDCVATFPFRNLDGEWVVAQYDISRLNPLGKVPFLATDDGTVLYASQVVVEYLDTIGGERRLFPETGPRRFDALRRMAIGDAVFDFAVQMSMEGWRHAAERRADLYRWLWPKIEKAYTQLEHEAPGWQAFDIGHVGLLQGISYVDAWAADNDDIPENRCRQWRDRWPALAAWYDATIERESVRRYLHQPYRGDTSVARFDAAVEEVLALQAKSQ